MMEDNSILVLDIKSFGNFQECRFVQKIINIHFLVIYDVPMGVLELQSLFMKIELLPSQKLVNEHVQWIRS